MTNEREILLRLTSRLQQERRECHRRVLALLDDLTEEQIQWRPGPHAPAIGFHAWHLGRWADHDANLIDGRPQVWKVRDLAAAWGIPAIALGEDDTGTVMGDDVSEAIIWPDKATLVAYIRTAFESLDDAIGELSVESLSRPVHNPHTDDPTITDMLFAYETHDNGHLGMIESIRGFLGLQGTATR